MEDRRPVAACRARRPHRWFAITMIVTILLYTVYGSRGIAPYIDQYIRLSSRQRDPILPPSPPPKIHELDPAAVPLEIHIMSKCPDAQYCLKELILPTMVRVSDKVNFTLSYIGKPTANDGVQCMHGPAECMGNIIELCAVHLYPDVKVHLGFTNCLTQDYPDIPDSELVESCALEFGIDKKKINDCASKDTGAFGLSLLRESVKRTRDVCTNPAVPGEWNPSPVVEEYCTDDSKTPQAGVTKSCTVRLNEEIYCVRDSGEWKDCPSGADVDTLVTKIEDQYRRESA